MMNRTGNSHEIGKNQNAIRFHHQRLQAVQAVGGLPGLSGHRGGGAFSPRLPGLRHLHAPLHHQPFPGAHGHRLLLPGGEAGGLRRRPQPQAGPGQRHEQIRGPAHRGGHHLSDRNHRRRRARDGPGVLPGSCRPRGRDGVAGDRHGLHPQLFRHPHGRLPRRGQGPGGAAGPGRRSHRRPSTCCRASSRRRISAT